MWVSITWDVLQCRFLVHMAYVMRLSISIGGADAAGSQTNFGKQGCRKLQLPHSEII